VVVPILLIFFLFLTSPPLNFANIYGPQKNLQNYTSTAVGHSGRDPVCLKKIIIFLWRQILYANCNF
jgi:hypothetical protein